MPARLQQVMFPIWCFPLICTLASDLSQPGSALLSMLRQGPHAVAVPELLQFPLASSQEFLFPLKPGLELSDLIKHQIQVLLPEVVDPLTLFGREVLQVHVAGHVLDVHQAAERLAHVHVLQGDGVLVRAALGAAWRPSGGWRRL